MINFCKEKLSTLCQKTHRLPLFWGWVQYLAATIFNGRFIFCWRGAFAGHCFEGFGAWGFE